MILVDTGPLLAFVNKRDQYHRWSVKQFDSLEEPFYSCEAVFAETVYQLLGLGVNPDMVVEYVTDGDIKILPAFSSPDQQNRVRGLIDKYNDLPCDFADACLVRLYEEAREPAKIITLDSDFTIYRTQQGQPLSLMSPHY